MQPSTSVIARMIGGAFLVATVFTVLVAGAGGNLVLWAMAVGCAGALWWGVGEVINESAEGDR